eukprot:277638_1
MFTLRILHLTAHIKTSSCRSISKTMRVVAIRRLSHDANLKTKGQYDTKFKIVRQCFDMNLNNFLKGYGGALCIYLDNKCVLDIYGGQYGWKGSTQPWEKETFTNAFSNAKAVGGVTILHQIDKGLMSLDDPLTKYWPEFGQNGKDNITVRDVLSHQSGCCIVDVTPSQPPDYKAVINALETMAPNYTPKQGLAYHTFTIGYFINELTRRVSGVSANKYFVQNIKTQLGLQIHELSITNPVPVSRLYCPLSVDDDHPFFVALGTEEFPVAQAWKPWKDLVKNDGHETEQFYKWDIPTTGFGNARGLATFANKILNNKEHKKVISDEMRKQCLSPVVVNETCQLLDAPFTISLSHFGCDDQSNYLLNGKGVFSAGLGQSFGFLNEDENIAIGYTPSRAHEGLLPSHAEWIVNDLFPSIRSALR